MHTIDKGEVARYLAIAHFIKMGMIVSLPVTENTPYDLIIDYDRKLYRVQIKKLIPQNNGTLKLPACSKGYKNGKFYDIKYTSVSIDWLIGVDTEKNKFYRIDYTSGEFDGYSGFLLRTEPTKNNNSTRVRFAKDYEF